MFSFQVRLSCNKKYNVAADANFQNVTTKCQDQ